MKRGSILALVLCLSILCLNLISAVENCKYQIDGCYVNSILYYGISVYNLGSIEYPVCGIQANWGGTTKMQGPGNIYSSTDCNLLAGGMPEVTKDGYKYTQGVSGCQTASSWPKPPALKIYKICRTPKHGDGLIKCDTGSDGCETCDDGNVVSLDGCDSTCQIEPGYTCTGSPSVCTKLPGCNDLVCSTEEKKSNPYCPSDCDISKTCGDGFCNEDYGEDFNTCSIDCPKNCLLGNDDIIMKLSASENAHGALWSDTNSKYSICYSDIFESPYEGPMPHDFIANNKVLGLSAITNAHAEIPSATSYTNKVSYGDLTCTAKATCDTGETCVVTISGNTDAHLAACDSVNPFATKICCSPYVCVPTKNCANTAPYQCGTFTDDCGTERNCDQEIGTCPGSYSCVNNVCTNREARLWTDASRIPFVNEGIVNVEIDKTTILLNLLNDNSVNIGDDVVFEIYGTSSLDGDEFLITSLSTKVTDKNKDKINASWTISSDDLVDLDLNELIKFIVNEEDSENPIYLKISQECDGILYCSSYTDSATCVKDSCNVRNISVEEDLNVTCGISEDGCYKYSCSCKWDGTKCGPSSQRNQISDIGECKTEGGEPFDNLWQGNCFVDETIETSCSEDNEFMSYSWTGDWSWGTPLSAGQILDNSLVTIVGANRYYDPLNKDKIKESEACKNSVGEKTVPCPSQLKLGFFNFWNLIVSLSLVAGIYVWRIMRRK